MFHNLKKKRHQGQGMTEYLILVGLLAVSSIAIVKVAGTNLKVGFGKISSALAGKKFNGAQTLEATKSRTQMRDLNDFNSND